MPSCDAQGCKNSSKKGYKMCSFPIKDKERSAIWVANTPKRYANWTPTKYSVLCQVVFSNSYFYISSKQGDILMMSFATVFRNYVRKESFL
ncbi:hypothetical protein ALC62_10483 [Cyphomyrmex costatus]|uniref:THAP-type domain-containing protein n=1 Tax=Cyphomyrmex costatus TaxID=456900 RepID=A0A151IDR7_9HYME|nr:hypothetical protein ALC62_10482 [Cyphomyrmex costatus]KYM98794.1 hypothetical protein ALC62_10483 [Cyphomyrmex costatus]